MDCASKHLPFISLSVRIRVTVTPELADILMAEKECGGGERGKRGR